MRCIELFSNSYSLPFEWVPLCPTFGEAASQSATLGSGSWAPAGVIVGLFAVLVALFKDEFWHWRHAPQLKVTLAHGAINPFAFEVHVENTSKRLAAEDVTVRVVELEPHPLERATGPKWFTHIVPLDHLLPRTSGETSFALAPGSAARLPFVNVTDPQSDDQPVLALLNWTEHPPSNTEERAGLLVLPSTDERRRWSEMHPDLAEIMSAPAMIRLEVAASNVAAQLYTVKLAYNVDGFPGGFAPMNPHLRIGMLESQLVQGSEPYNQTPHAGSLPIGRTQAEADAELADDTRADE